MRLALLFKQHCWISLSQLLAFSSFVGIPAGASARLIPFIREEPVPDSSH